MQVIIVIIEIILIGWKGQRTYMQNGTRQTNKINRLAGSTSNVIFELSPLLSKLALYYKWTLGSVDPVSAKGDFSYDVMFVC